MVQQYKRCIFILADGARPDVLREELKLGNLPHISRYLIENGSFEEMLTVFPSTTGPAYFPFINGCHPGTFNVPGIRWFDRASYAERGWSFKSFRSYVGLETFLINPDSSQQYPSIFDNSEDSYNILSGVYKGIRFKNNLTALSRIWYYYYAHLTDRWDFIDEQMSQKLISLISKKPEYVFVTYPGIDEISHRTSPFSERTRNAYHQLDRHVGNMIEALKNNGIYDDTLIAMASDHGLSETSRHFDISPFLDTKGYKTLYYTQIFKRNVNAASMVSGNGMAHLYFKSEKGWDEPCYFEELSHKSLLLDEIRLRPEVDLVASKGGDGKIHLLTERGHGYFKVHDSKVDYEWSGYEPLNLNLPEKPKNVSMSFDDSYAKTFNTHYPDVFYQLHMLFKSPRSGDVIVSAKPGHDLRDKYEVPEHKASHGSICPEHMKIPFIINHPITNKTAMRSMDVYPTILKLLGKNLSHSIDGKSLV
ncbi:alkaline phosphatase family protein [bacterium]|nr:alkaline phosphatase family protein [bacterium]